MKSLSLPDRRHLSAAHGWLELGNHAEANEKLENIRAELRAHPGALRVHWEIYAAAKKWEAALDIADALVRLAPEEAVGWVNRSFCLHELGRTPEARDNLLPVAEKFPDDAIMRYNLSCCECRLGRMDQARGWLEEPFELGHPRNLNLMAVEDAGLEPLWKGIGEL